MIQVVYSILGAIALTVIVYVILEVMGQKSMAKLVTLVGILHISVTFFGWMIPAVNDTKVKIGKIGQDVDNFTKAIDKVGTGIEKIGGTKENIDKAVDKTKVPGLDKIDKSIENWWSQLLNGKEKKK